jgi:hypothetical protein
LSLPTKSEKSSDPAPPDWRIGYYSMGTRLNKVVKLKEILGGMKLMEIVVTRMGGEIHFET